MKQFLTVNADDFGRCSSRNEAINTVLLSNKSITASIMMNMGDSTNEAVQLSKDGRYSERINLHLNLTYGIPLTSSIICTPICKYNAFGISNNIELTKKAFDYSTIKAIRIELEQQMRLFREAGFESEHLDSHMWIMCNLPVLVAVKPLIKKYGFKTTRTIRGHLERASSNKKIQLYYQFIERLYNFIGLKPYTNWAGCTYEYSNAIFGKNTSVECYIHPDYLDRCLVDTVYKYPNMSKDIYSVLEEINSI